MLCKEIILKDVLKKIIKLYESPLGTEIVYYLSNLMDEIETMGLKKWFMLEEMTKVMFDELHKERK